MPKIAEEDIQEELSPQEEGSAISIPENFSKDDLVDLIERPAWKTILIELVKTERMDPWAIDVAQLAEKYLAKINSLGGNDLRLPANAILASAILLKFKSNVLRLSDIEDEDDFEQKKAQMSPEERAEFEALLPELKNIRKIKEGKVSLDELVASIEKMLQSSKKMKDRSLLRSERTQFKIPLSGFDIDKAMDKVYKNIQKHADSQGLLLFSRLVKEQDTNEAIVRTFIPCLFLTNKGKINMWQDEFFGEIFLSVNKH